MTPCSCGFQQHQGQPCHTAAQSIANCSWNSPGKSDGLSGTDLSNTNRCYIPTFVGPNPPRAANNGGGAAMNLTSLIDISLLNGNQILEPFLLPMKHGNDQNKNYIQQFSQDHSLAPQVPIPVTQENLDTIPTPIPGPSLALGIISETMKVTSSGIVPTSPTDTNGNNNRDFSPGNNMPM